MTAAFPSFDVFELLILPFVKELSVLNFLTIRYFCYFHILTKFIKLISNKSKQGAEKNAK